MESMSAEKIRTAARALFRDDGQCASAERTPRPIDFSFEWFAVDVDSTGFKSASRSSAV